MEELEKEKTELLKEILEVLKKRAIGHTIMYSDRVRPFINKIEMVLEKDK
jgi:hypothetical protein